MCCGPLLPRHGAGVLALSLGPAATLAECCARCCATLRSGSGGSVVGVVGASHLAGMQRLWDSGGWRDMMAHGLLAAPSGPPTPETPQETGVRWGEIRAELQGCGMKVCGCGHMGVCLGVLGRGGMFSLCMRASTAGARCWTASSG